ncbi:MAG: HIT family protein [Tenericutes bacterium HGW-Tenericutes-5]|jgi:histidine triad (HIT) family protein|nr:MAG: HIT family protein [Tenericutes bacterium HGW-Tenericutes-5]
MDCIFCKIVNNEIPSYKIYEDDILIAILDISQTTKGHTLIILKKHYKNLYELDATASSEIFKIVPKIVNAIKKSFNPIGLNLIINTEKPLQTVEHFHIHLIPRYENDKFDIHFQNNQNEMTTEKYISVKEIIKNNL